MKLLKQEKWWVWLLLFIFAQTSSTLVLGALLDVYDKDAWYAKWKNWLIGFLCLVIPALIMAVIFYIQISVKTASKLNVPGSELYLSPYVWLLFLIVPLIGWSMFIVLITYIQIWNIVMLYRGAGNKYAK